MPTQVEQIQKVVIITEKQVNTIVTILSQRKLLLATPVVRFVTKARPAEIAVLLGGRNVTKAPGVLVIRSFQNDFAI